MFIMNNMGSGLHLSIVDYDGTAGNSQLAVHIKTLLITGSANGIGRITANVGKKQKETQI